MSARILITFGGAAYDEITAQVVESHPGADVLWVYDDRWLAAHEFWQLNSWLREHRSPLADAGRGLGWYAWKPLILLDAVSRLRPGDSVAYIDGDSKPIADISVLFDTALRDGAMLFRSSGHMQHRYCTRDCTVVMGLDPAHLHQKRIPGRTDYLEMPAGCARFMSFAVGPWKPKQLLMEWLTYAINPMATTFEPSVLGPEPHGFTEHRTEQAILTMLAHKYGYTLWREADQDGLAYRGQPGEPGDYGQLFEQCQRGGPHPLGSGSRFRTVEMT